MVGRNRLTVRTAVVTVLVLAVATSSATTTSAGSISLPRTSDLSPHGTTSLDPQLDLGEDRGRTALPYAPPVRAPHRSARLVLAHYHPFYPLSKDDADPSSDIYTQRYLTNTGDGRRHTAYGGLFRDRPLPREPLGGNFGLKDLRTEIRRAVAAGLDGFTFNLIGTAGGNGDTAIRRMLRAAAAVDPTFTITLMPDLYRRALRPSAAAMAANLADLARHPSIHRHDGRLVVAPFGPDREGAGYWSQVIDRLEQQHGEEVFFVPCLLDYWNAVEEFAPLSAGLSAWGYRNVDADVHHDVAAMAADAHNRDKLWMHPVAYGDSRPANNWFNESQNSSLLRHTFGTARSTSAEWVQVITWNDYAENTFVSPSPTIGWAVLDLVSYFADWFRSGARPRVTRDVVYLSYRRQRHDQSASLQPLPMSVREQTPPRDVIEALVFLRRSSTVRVTVGGTSRVERVDAGMQVITVPLETGLPSVAVERRGDVVVRVSGLFPIVANPQVQTLNYYMVSSGRTGRPRLN